eukprot:XP_017949448.1 PREDICTED: phospholipase B1, membrane-associated-like [Xenopus tropicalis]
MSLKIDNQSIASVGHRAEPTAINERFFVLFQTTGAVMSPALLPFFPSLDSMNQPHPKGLCDCIVVNDHNSLPLETVKLYNKKYQEMTYQLVETGRYDTKEDFAVVVQPFFEFLEVPKSPEGVPDRSYMSPDCFHFGEKGHSQSARALWKNMFEPVGQKTQDQSLAEDIGIYCPTQSDPFVKTARNSNFAYPTTAPDPVSFLHS